MSSIIDKWIVHTPRHEEIADHAIPPADECVGGEITSDHNLQMIRKLGEDKKANWPGHLDEIVQAYNATQSAMMGYSLHYLMFGCRPRLSGQLLLPHL